MCGGGEVALENRDGVQVPRIARGGTKAGAGKSQLAAGRAVRSVAEEIEAEQGVVVEDSVRSTDDGFAVSLGVPGNADAGLNVIFVGLNAFLESQIVVSGLCQCTRGFKLGGNSTS